MQSRIPHVLNLHGQIRNLKRMASRDFLTDLFNRRYFFDRGPILVENCLRQTRAGFRRDPGHRPFKKLNDNYGHEVGDLVLKTIARRLRAVVGEKSTCSPVSAGRNFGIIFANMGVRKLSNSPTWCADDISRARSWSRKRNLAVTISMGLAEISAPRTFDNYLNAADQYLYMAKHSAATASSPITTSPSR